MPPRLRILLLVFASSAVLAGVAHAQQWSEPAPSHYARGLSQPTEVAPPPLPPQPIHLVSGAERMAPQSTPGIASEAHAPLRLAPRERSSAGAIERPAATTPLDAVGSVGGSLAVVLGLFLAVVWFSRKLSPAGSLPLPKEAVELLGRAPLGPRQQMQLVRLGNKLVLLSVSTTGAESLAEVTDAAEVERLSAICRRQQPGSSSASFTQLLTQIGNEPAPRGFVGDARSPEAAAGRRR